MTVISLNDVCNVVKSMSTLQCSDRGLRYWQHGMVQAVSLSRKLDFCKLHLNQCNCHNGKNISSQLQGLQPEACGPAKLTSCEVVRYGIPDVYFELEAPTASSSRSSSSSSSSSSHSSSSSSSPSHSYESTSSSSLSSSSKSVALVVHLVQLELELE